MSALRVENVFKNFHLGSEKLEILKGVSFAIEDGESVAIQGPSGCGKSTLVSIIAGLDRPTSGNVNILGKETTKFSRDEWSQFRGQNIGIIFQQFHLLEHLTALQNVSLPLDLRGEQQADGLATAALAQVGLEKRLKHFPRELSRGECQRMAIARLLVLRPKLLLADEPTASLDGKTGEKVTQLMFELAKAHGIASLVVTHDPNVASLCDRRLFMEDGLLIDKTPAANGVHPS